MQNPWLKKLKLNYSNEVIDIVQFGSSIFPDGNPRDIDVSVIFKKIPVKDQLIEAQKIKRQLEKFADIPIHISSFDFYSLFDKSNFSKEGILFYGKSLINGNYFAEQFKLNPRIQISYSLKKLKKSDKIRFNYMLNGRGKKYGILRKYDGKLVNPGLIEISPEFENIFTENIGKITPDFKVRKILF